MKLLATDKAAVTRSGDQWALDAIPPFPAIALRALNMMTGTDSSLLELCDLIRSDPVFSGAVLRMANSPLIGFPHRISSVLQASMLLGFRRLKSVVITIGLKCYLEENYTPLLRSCWRHCLACAVAAEQAAAPAMLDKNFAHTAGILHDIGRVAMAASMPRSYAKVLESEVSEGNDLLRVERDLCGIDHCEAGSRLIEAWALPPLFMEIVSGHHSVQAGSQDIVSLVRSCCRLSDSCGFAEANYRSLPNYSEVFAEIPERLRRDIPEDAKKMAARVKKEIRVIESA